MRFPYPFCVVVALQLVCCPGLFAAEPPATIRHLPPEGIDPALLAEQLEPADRQAWEEVPERLAALRQRLEYLRLADEATRSDMEVFLKGVEWALAGGSPAISSGRLGLSMLQPSAWISCRRDMPLGSRKQG